MTFLNLFSPVEQFLILPVIPLWGGLSVNNLSFFLLLSIGFILLSFLILNRNIDLINNNLSGVYIVPNNYQIIFEIIIKGGINVIRDNIASKDSQFFFPIVFSLFLFLISSNVIGLIPYSYTITSHLVVTFALSLFLFIGINIICIKMHKFDFFGLFLPSGTSTILAFLLVPIEFISYIFKPISLSIRLFANMMAGHTLLKVIAGFSWTLALLGNFIFTIVHLIPVIILVPLFILESAVALIQSFVFTVLICIYINDAINLH